MRKFACVGAHQCGSIKKIGARSDRKRLDRLRILFRSIHLIVVQVLQEGLTSF